MMHIEDRWDFRRNWQRINTFFCLVFAFAIGGYVGKFIEDGDRAGWTIHYVRYFTLAPTLTFWKWGAITVLAILAFWVAAALLAGLVMELYYQCCCCGCVRTWRSWRAQQDDGIAAADPEGHYALSPGSSDSDEEEDEEEN